MKHLRLFPEARRLIACLTETEIVDEGLVQELGVELMKVARQARSCGKLVLDFRRVKSMSSAMIGKLVLVNKETKIHRTELSLWNVRPTVMRVFRITRLHQVFTLTDESEDRDEDPLRFVPELFQSRNEVLAALENADYHWWRDYGTVCPVHDLHGIEVCGIRLHKDAKDIRKILKKLFPLWKRSKVWVSYRWGADPNWNSRIHRDAGRPYETWDSEET